MFNPLNHNPKSGQPSQEFMDRRKLIFDVFTSPDGAKVLAMFEEGIKRRNKIPCPQTADQQVNYLTYNAQTEGMEKIVREITNNVEAHKKQLAQGLKLTKGEEIDE